MRPAVLITDAYNALNNQPQRKQRDQEFIGKLLFDTLSYSRGNLADRVEIFVLFVSNLSGGCLNNCRSFALTDMILKVLRADGNVLLPVDTAGRVLELILHLESVSTNVMMSALYI